MFVNVIMCVHYVETNEQPADIFTKGITSKAKWKYATQLIGISDDSQTDARKIPAAICIETQSPRCLSGGEFADKGERKEEKEGEGQIKDKKMGRQDVAGGNPR